MNLHLLWSEVPQRYIFLIIFFVSENLSSATEKGVKCHLWHLCRSRGAGHWPRKGVWGCAALKTPFSHLSCRLQGSHFKQKSQFTRPPFEKTQILAHKPPNLEIFSSQAPLFSGKCQFEAPHFGNPGRTPLPDKKLSVSPGCCYLRKPAWFSSFFFQIIVRYFKRTTFKTTHVAFADR